METLGSAAQCMRTVHWAFLGAKTVFAEWFPTASRICRLLTYYPFTVRTADEHGSRTKQKGQIFKFSLCKIPNQASVASAESLLCPVRKRHGVPPATAIEWPLHMATLLSPTLARQLQHFMSQQLKNSHGWKCFKQHRVFMTSTPGLSWHPVLAAASYLSSTASVPYSELLQISVCSRYTQPSN